MLFKHYYVSHGTVQLTYAGIAPWWLWRCTQLLPRGKNIRNLTLAAGAGGFGVAPRYPPLPPQWENVRRLTLAAGAGGFGVAPRCLPAGTETVRTKAARAKQLEQQNIALGSYRRLSPVSGIQYHCINEPYHRIMY